MELDINLELVNWYFLGLYIPELLKLQESSLPVNRHLGMCSSFSEQSFLNLGTRVATLSQILQPSVPPLSFGAETWPSQSGCAVMC